MKLLVSPTRRRRTTARATWSSSCSIGFGGDCRRQHGKSPDGYGIECYHVNARFSKTLEDVGEFQGAKIFLIVCFTACRPLVPVSLRCGRSLLCSRARQVVAVYRDWLVMLFCRPFFKNIILHWHAAGLAKWLETAAQIRSRASPTGCSGRWI